MSKAQAMRKMQIEGERRVTVRNALRQGMAKLAAAQTPSHALAAELLLMHVLGQDRAWIYAHPEAETDWEAAENFFELIERRAQGVPTQYLTGKQEFWGLKFEVTPAVLIPRPETEHVIEVALYRLRASKGNGSGLRVADVGTGSGCIAVALAKELLEAKILATDISPGALEIARRNAERHGVLDHVHFVQCDLLDAPSVTARHFDLIVSNPPYVACAKEKELAREVREYEPHGALFGGITGAEIYPRLIAQASEHLPTGGLLVMEIGFGAAHRVQASFDENVWTDILIANDLARIPRVISAKRK